MIAIGSLRLLRLSALVSAVFVASPAFAQGPTVTHPVITPPTAIQRVEAHYPESALATGDHVDVLLELTIDAEGHVTKAIVLTSGGTEFDNAAMAAAKSWLFAPAKRDGKPAESRIHVPFHFAPPEIVSATHDTHTGGQTDVAKKDSSQGEVAQTTTPPTTAVRSFAKPPPQETTPTEDDIEDVTVFGPIQRRTVGITDYNEHVGELGIIPRTNASELLKLAPGFLLTNEGGSGHAEQVFLRGFDAHEGQDLEFTVDGVPINDSGNYHGNGYADTHFIIPELVESVRVLEGPYAPQQGNFAVAGSADYHLGLDRRGLTTEYTTGTYNTQRLLVLYGPKDAPSGTFAGAEYFTTDGFGTNRQAQRGTAVAQYEIPAGRKATLRINATAYVTEFNNAGVVRNDDYAAGRVGFYGTEDPNQTGNEASRVSLSMTYERRFEQIDFSQQAFFIDRTMRLRENWTGFLLDVQEPTQEPHDQRGDLIDFHFDEVTMGARGFARWHGNAFGLRQEFEGGYYARVDLTGSQQYRDAAGTEVPYLTNADYSSTLGDIGVYVDGSVHFTRWLGLRGGVRADMFTFDVLNNCAVQNVANPSKTSPEIDAPCLSELEHGAYREPFTRNTTASGAIMPRGTVVVGPFNHFEFSGSVGDGVRTVDPSYVGQALQTPFINVQSKDIGVAYGSGLGHDLTLVAKSDFFQTHVDQDLIFDPTQGRNTLGGGSTRTGWAGSMRLVGSFFDLAANATIVKAVFDDSGTCAPTCGLLVPYIPDLIVRGDLVLFHDLPWKIDHKPVRATLGYGVSYVGRRPLPYGQTSDVIFVSDASLGVRWWGWNVRVAAQNLFNAQYKLGEYNYASDFHSAPSATLVPERSFTAGAPLQVMVSLAATLGGT